VIAEVDYRTAGYDASMNDHLVLQPTPGALPALRDRLLEALAAAVPYATVHEVGSTTLPDVPGKGDLDVLVRAPAHRFEDARTALDARWPRNPAQYSAPDYQGYLVPNAAEVDAAIQLTVADGPHDTFLQFLDTLRGDPGLRAAYADLKRRWDGHPMGLYRQDKASFVALALASREPGVRGGLARLLAVSWRDTTEVLLDEPSPCWIGAPETLQTAGATVPWCPQPAPPVAAPHPDLAAWFGWWCHPVHARFDGRDLLLSTAYDEEGRARALVPREGRVTVAIETWDAWYALDLATGQVERLDPPLPPVVVASDLAAFARALTPTG
jgi:GrpB-like predicted nucleotidyltransferase (UPF0157 family)